MKHAGWLLVLVACAHNVSGDGRTGPDGKIRGATPVVLQDGEAKARGIITYPGGDRVDWKMLELPADRSGKLELQLTWQTPRPGLRLEFDVFDQWNTPVAKAATNRGRRRTATIDNAVGKYFVRVYAPRRTDAGEYKLQAHFEPGPPPGGTGPHTIQIPDPPKLPAVPEPEQLCEPFDIKVKACEKVCPAFGAPPGWPPCAAQQQAAAAAAAAAAATAALPPPPKPVSARAISVTVVDDGTVVTLAIGSDSAPGLDKNWTGNVLIGKTTNPLAGGSVKIIRVEKTRTIVKTSLKVDQLNANPQVRLSPPTSP